MTYNPEIHHRRSIRLQGYDYACGGAYFVTVCVQGRECLFGEIAGGEMRLNDAGAAVQSVWEGLPERFSSIELDAAVIMPNHFHGIILLSDRRGEPRVRPDVFACRGESCIRPKTDGDQKDQGDHKDRPYGTRDDSLGRIIQAFKSFTTVEYVRGVERNGWPSFPGKLWQRNYYERIIRNDAELAAIREYIVTNPQRWVEDEENPDNAPLVP